MENIAELNTSKVPLVIIDLALNKLKGVVLSHEKVKKAKQAITRLSLPKNHSLKSVQADN